MYAYTYRPQNTPVCYALFKTFNPVTIKKQDKSTEYEIMRRERRMIEHPLHKGYAKDKRKNQNIQTYLALKESPEQQFRASPLHCETKYAVNAHKLKSFRKNRR